MESVNEGEIKYFSLTIINANAGKDLSELIMKNKCFNNYDCNRLLESDSVVLRNRFNDITNDASLTVS